MLDLRLPSGLFFAITGLVLIILGIVSPDMRGTLSESNVNLWAGEVMLVFGGFLLFLARREASRNKTS